MTSGQRTCKVYITEREFDSDESTWPNRPPLSYLCAREYLAAAAGARVCARTIYTAAASSAHYILLSSRRRECLPFYIMLDRIITAFDCRYTVLLSFFLNIGQVYVSFRITGDELCFRKGKRRVYAAPDAKRKISLQKYSRLMQRESAATTFQLLQFRESTTTGLARARARERKEK